MSTASFITDESRQLADAAFLTLVTDSDVRRDPYPTLHAVRAAAPVLQSGLGTWVLTRYEDCYRVLRDPRCGKDWDGLMMRTGFDNWREHPSLAYGETSMLFANPPQHTRLRRLVAKAFTPRTVEKLKPRMAATVDELLDPLAEAGGGDLLDALAFPLPVTVIGDLLGAAVDDRAPFREAVRLNTRTLEMNVTREDVEAADVAATWTTNLIGNGMHHLLCHPDELSVLRKDPSVLPDAVEELVRYDGSILLSGRSAVEDMEIDGHTIRAGEGILTILGAANRDPARYPDPDRLDVRRQGVEPLSFGSGIHYCLGANLARAEAALAIGRLLQRFPHIDAAGAPRFRDQFVFRGLESLHVSCSTS